MWANLITTFRMLLTLVVIMLLQTPDSAGYLWAFVLTIVIIWMDGLDGYVARKLGESSTFGAVYDILGDRVVEQLYWVTFAVLGWVGLWVPLVVIARGVLVDGFRSIALQQGYTAFGSSSMMRTSLGVVLTSSRFSRWTYAALKAVVFALIILWQWSALQTNTQQWYGALTPWIEGCVVATVVFCLVRGLPVLLETPAYLSQVDKTPKV